ncbi:MAG: hypothetical protein FJ399_21260, partial [Verrucomicrobia bacterium]|nr:hypothetical protein [Verrucomicrobiota bacterium]
MFRTTLFAVVVWCVAAPAFPQVRPAAPPVSPTRLPQLVVTPTGLAIEAFDAPFIVEVLDAGELQER